jgi:hypothetical protein
VLLCCRGHAYRLPDGRKLNAEGWTNTGTFALVRSDRRDVVFYSGGGEHGGWEKKGKCEQPPPAAVQYTLDGDRLIAKVLWCGVNGVGMPRNTACMVYYRGKLYWAAGFILDPDTGKALAGPKPGRKPRRGDWVVPQTRHFLAVAAAAGAGRIYGLREKQTGREKNAPRIGLCEVYDLAGGKLAESTLSRAPAEGEKLQQIIHSVGGKRWSFSFSCPFAIVGDRIYIRSNDYLYCIGRK